MMQIQIPEPELVNIEDLKIDGRNPNRMTAREHKALFESIRRYGFIVPIIANKDLLVADGEQRLSVAKSLGMRQVSVIRLPVEDVDRRLLRQVLNKLRGEHDVFLDAEEYYRIVCEDKRDLLKVLANESDLRIDNLLKLREPEIRSDEDLKALASQFSSRVENNRLDGEQRREHLGEPLTLKCHAEFSTKAPVTERTLAVCEAFGLGVDETKRFVVFDNFSFDFHRGDLIYVTGDSGGGKSLLLKAFKSFFGDEAVELSDLHVDPEETLIEGVGKDVREALEILSLCGLNDAFLFLRKYKELSDGQKWRYRLAKLANSQDKSVWIIDEFCVFLDRVMAKVVAFLIQKIARKLGKTVIVGTAHGDLVEDFQPDILVEKGFEQDVKVSKMSVRKEKCSVYGNIRIEKGAIEDYERLRRFHYRSKNEPEAGGLRMKDCFKLLYCEDLIGVVVYSFSYLNLKPRSMVFGDRYVYTPGDQRKAVLINEEIARISRVVIHPKFRGIGLGALLVRETLPKVNAKVVEALGVMVRYNPFLERAGMLRLDYTRTETTAGRKTRDFLQEHNLGSKLSNSKDYCRKFLGQLSDEDRKTLIGYLSEFASHPFIEAETFTPALLTKVFSSESVYLYWIAAAQE